MSLWKDAQRPALKTEEAALLTALPRHEARGAALKTVLRAGQRMGEMRLGAPLATGNAGQPAIQTRSVPTRTDRSRAALYQVWKKR